MNSKTVKNQIRKIYQKLKEVTKLVEAEEELNFNNHWVFLNLQNFQNETLKFQKSS